MQYLYALVLVIGMVFSESIVSIFLINGLSTLVMVPAFLFCLFACFYVPTVVIDKESAIDFMTPNGTKNTFKNFRRLTQPSGLLPFLFVYGSLAAGLYFTGFFYAAVVHLLMMFSFILFFNKLIKLIYHFVPEADKL